MRVPWRRRMDENDTRRVTDLQHRVAVLETDIIDLRDRVEHLTVTLKRMAGRESRRTDLRPETHREPTEDEKLLQIAMREIAAGTSQD